MVFKSSPEEPGGRPGGWAVNNAQLDWGTRYRIEAEVVDLYGNTGRITSVLEVAPSPVVPVASPKGTMVMLFLNGEVLASLPLSFSPYSSDLSVVEGDLRRANDAALT